MNKHTPGPWTVEPGHYPGMIDIKGPSFGIAVVLVASDLDFNDHSIRTSDANLIAAAPDLLEALIDVRRALELANFTGELAVVDAAIAKAKGLA